MVQLAGASSPGARLATRGEGTDKMMAVELASDGRVLYAVCTNSPRDFRQLRKLVSDGARVDATRFVDPSVPLAKTVL